MQLSLQSCETLSKYQPCITNVKLGSLPQATVYILEEISLNFPDANVEVDEGANLILTVTASTASDQDFNFTVNITGKDHDSQCKLVAILIGNGL